MEEFQKEVTAWMRGETPHEALLGKMAEYIEELIEEQSKINKRLDKIEQNTLIDRKTENEEQKIENEDVKMTLYEHLKLCNVEGMDVEEMADTFIVATRFLSNTFCLSIPRTILGEFSRSKEYEEAKKAIIKALNTEVDNAV